MNRRFIVREALRLIMNNIALAGIGQTIRVRRRGFRADIRRGDYLYPHDRQKSVPASADGKVWCVAKRSNWSLWLYETRIRRVGDHVTVRVPLRYQTEYGDTTTLPTVDVTRDA